MEKTQKALEAEINGDERYVRLSGIYKITLSDVKNFMVGGNYLRAAITINKGNKVVDGIDAEIQFDIEEDPCYLTALFCILKNVRELKIVNLTINIRYRATPSDAKIYGILNNSFGFVLRNSRIAFETEQQINYTAIHNEGVINTSLETQADNFWACGNHIRAICAAQVYDKECIMCGIDNRYANTVCIANNYIFIKNVGIGEWQKAYGIKNSGRYARVENNNIKANGSYSLGKILEAAHTCGMMNEAPGEYLIFTGNNCVGEWGGTCVGLFNKATFANITGNKILATHTIKGRTAVLYGACGILANNILTNTSRNPRYVELRAEEIQVCNNYMKGLLALDQYQSGVGIWMDSLPGSRYKAERCLITNNIIACARDFGIVMKHTADNIIANNQFTKFKDAEDYVPILVVNGESERIENNSVPANCASNDSNLMRNFDELIVSIK